MHLYVTALLPPSMGTSGAASLLLTDAPELALCPHPSSHLVSLPSYTATNHSFSVQPVSRNSHSSHRQSHLLSRASFVPPPPPVSLSVQHVHPFTSNSTSSHSKSILLPRCTLISLFTLLCSHSRVPAFPMRAGLPRPFLLLPKLAQQQQFISHPFTCFHPFLKSSSFGQ